jgi:cell division protein FtsI/penicillin-binding protein 2
MRALIPLFGRVVRFAAQACLSTVVLSLSAAEPRHSALSDAVDHAFAGEQGAAVVVRVSDSKVLAAHNLPLLTRRVTAPGSAIKPFTLELLLESGAINPQTTIACRRPLKIAGRTLNCVHPPELQTFQAEQALAFSCNSYFVTAAARLKAGELERRFKQLGFNRPSGLLPEEGEGRVDMANSTADRQLLAIGVAGIEVTPLELAAAYLQLARVDSFSATGAQKIVLSGLRDATDYGLAQNARTESLSVAGKTGTATDRADPHTHAWFAGFAPGEKPEIVVVVFVERGRGGVEAAGIAHRIFQAYAEQRP